MKKTSKTVLFFGNERLATGVTSQVVTLRALLAAGYEVPAVIVAQNETGPSRRRRELEIAAVAKQHGIAMLSPDDLKSAKDQLARFNALAAVLAAYGKIVPQVILDLFPQGIINIHPSLLPQHRGPTPIENVILSGASETGVSLIRLDAEMDTGPIYDQKTLALTGNETKQELADRAAAAGSDMLIEHLPAILDGSLQPSPQDESGAGYDRLITKDDGRLDWQKPAVELEREVRAFAGWPRSRARLGPADVIVTATHVAPGGGEPGKLSIIDKKVAVQTSDGVLVIDSLTPAGKKEMSSTAFLAGYEL
jgi:methionyl-tRNA formyltransferase